MADWVAAERLRGYGSSIFTEMTALAAQTGAINLGQGFPDSDGPAELRAAACEAIMGGFNQYPPASGVAELRSAISDQRQKAYGTAYDPDAEIMITIGATEALAATMIALCEPGDEVLVFEPYYDSYAAAIAMAGARRRTITLAWNGVRFAFDPEQLEAQITARTRLLLLNTPHNPTGKVFDRDELALIAELCEKHNLIAVTDEVYEYLTYDSPHITLASLPGMSGRTLTISSAGKTFSVTGWKVGWICGPRELLTAVRTAKQFLTFAGGTPFQLAVASGLRDCLPWVEELRLSLRRRRNELAEILTAGGIRTYPSDGTYFMQVDARSFGADDGAALCRDLPFAAGVVAIPSAAFYDSTESGRHLIRLAFCKNEQTLASAGHRLVAAAADMTKGNHD